MAVGSDIKPGDILNRGKKIKPPTPHLKKNEFYFVEDVAVGASGEYYIMTTKRRKPIWRSKHSTIEGFFARFLPTANFKKTSLKNFEVFHGHTLKLVQNVGPAPQMEDYKVNDDGELVHIAKEMYEMLDAFMGE